MIPLLREVGEAIIAVKKQVTSKRRRRVTTFARNVLVRAENLRRYVKGEDSAFDPNELYPALLTGVPEGNLGQST